MSYLLIDERISSLIDDYFEYHKEIFLISKKEGLKIEDITVGFDLGFMIEDIPEKIKTSSLFKDHEFMYIPVLYFSIGDDFKKCLERINECSEKYPEAFKFLLMKELPKLPCEEYIIQREYAVKTKDSIKIENVIIGRRDEIKRNFPTYEEEITELREKYLCSLR